MLATGREILSIGAAIDETSILSSSMGCRQALHLIYQRRDIEAPRIFTAVASMASGVEEGRADVRRHS